MTSSQRTQLRKAVETINEVRAMLDGIMYYSEPLIDEEHGKVRECYDNLCEITDKLYKL